MPKASTTANHIVKWYSENARELPWRKTTDPYKIWLSEIILQQTTVAQGTNYYLKFVTNYPTLKDLASAPIDDILKHWQGLGYYSRARNLHFTANHIVYNLNGEFPNTYDTLIKLKGVGAYTAAAIASFSFQENKVVVDGNVIRVIARFYGITEAVDEKTTLTKIKNLAQDLCDSQKPQIFNQAIMEFGALMCKAKKPGCSMCPLKKTCSSFKNNLVDQIPFKSKKIKKKTRFFKYTFFVIDDEKTLIQKREKKDIWQGLYQFPLMEVSGFDDKSLSFHNKLKINVNQILASPIFKQQLTHQTIHGIFYKVFITSAEYDKHIKGGSFEDYKLINIENIHNYAWPRLIDLYLNDLSITLF